MQDYKSPLEMFYHWENEMPNKLYMRQPINGEWHYWTWSETATQVRKMATYLKSLDFPDNSKIATLSKLLDVACISSTNNLNSFILFSYIYI